MSPEPLRESPSPDSRSVILRTALPLNAYNSRPLSGVNAEKYNLFPQAVRSDGSDPSEPALMSETNFVAFPS